MKIDIIPVIAPMISKDKVVEMGCDGMCSMCKYNKWSYECKFYSEPDYIPDKYRLGEFACPHFEQDEHTYIDENTTAKEKTRYKKMIAEWKEKNKNVDNRAEPKDLDFTDLNF